MLSDTQTTQLEEKLLPEQENCEIIQDDFPWYGIKLYTMRQQEIADYFAQHELETFIPQEYVDVETDDHKIKHILRPVVRNLLFLKKSKDEKVMREIIANCHYKLSVLTKGRADRAYYEIPAKQMFEFRVMCNPKITMRKFISEEEAHLKAGSRVIVKYGPMKGLTGRLVRSSKKYYLLKEVPGMAIMLKISRWCCASSEI
uniref:NusG-like N-terminal domain-containing protein n=1 Tax=Prevotella sp. GTC17253 TaxID=3236793 RepID=A0AB33IR04_9BACT